MSLANLKQVETDITEMERFVEESSASMDRQTLIEICSKLADKEYSFEFRGGSMKASPSTKQQFAARILVVGLVVFIFVWLIDGSDYGRAMSPIVPLIAALVGAGSFWYLRADMTAHAQGKTVSNPESTSHDVKWGVTLGGCVVAALLFGGGAYAVQAANRTANRGDASTPADRPSLPPTSGPQSSAEVGLIRWMTRIPAAA